MKPSIYAGFEALCELLRGQSSHSDRLTTRMFPGIAGFLWSQAVSLRTVGYPQKWVLLAVSRHPNGADTVGAGAKRVAWGLPSGPGRLHLVRMLSPMVVTAPPAPASAPRPRGRTGPRPTAQQRADAHAFLHPPTLKVRQRDRACLHIDQRVVHVLGVGLNAAHRHALSHRGRGLHQRLG